jgi:hypothetical protein
MWGGCISAPSPLFNHIAYINTKRARYRLCVYPLPILCQDLHTSACVSIRQIPAVGVSTAHPLRGPAYVSIRQHTPDAGCACIHCPSFARTCDGRGLASAVTGLIVL